MQNRKSPFPASVSPSNPYPFPELSRQWETEKLSHEHLSGQLLVWGQKLHAELTACQRQLEELEYYVADLALQMANGRLSGTDGLSTDDTELDNLE